MCRAAARLHGPSEWPAKVFEAGSECQRKRPQSGSLEPRSSLIGTSAEARQRRCASGGYPRTRVLPAEFHATCVANGGAARTTAMSNGLRSRSGCAWFALLRWPLPRSRPVPPATWGRSPPRHRSSASSPSLSSPGTSTRTARSPAMSGSSTWHGLFRDADANRDGVLTRHGVRRARPRRPAVRELRASTTSTPTPTAA